MDAHEYICLFSKFEYFIYFLVTPFFGLFFSSIGLVHIFGVDWFDEWPGFDNIDGE
jgi:hypothetical protein